MSKVWIEKEKKYGYILRVEGLRLVELWNTERITLWIVLLTLVSIFFIINVR
jgi:hypothetical protein